MINAPHHPAARHAAQIMVNENGQHNLGTSRAQFWVEQVVHNSKNNIQLGISQRYFIPMYNEGAC